VTTATRPAYRRCEYVEEYGASVRMPYSEHPCDANATVPIRVSGWADALDDLGRPCVLLGPEHDRTVWVCGQHAEYLYPPFEAVRDERDETAEYRHAWVVEAWRNRTAHQLPDREIEAILDELAAARRASEERHLAEARRFLLDVSGR